MVGVCFAADPRALWVVAACFLCNSQDSWPEVKQKRSVGLDEEKYLAFQGQQGGLSFAEQPKNNILRSPREPHKQEMAFDVLEHVAVPC